MDFQDVKPAHKQVIVAQRPPTRLDFQAITGDLGKIDRLPVLQGWMLGYADVLAEGRRNPHAGERMTLVRRTKTPVPNLYLFEHQPAPVPEWKAFRQLLAKPDVQTLNLEQINQIAQILGSYSSAGCQIKRIEFGGRTGLFAFKPENKKEGEMVAFLFVSDPARRIVEEVGENFTGATKEDRIELDEMFGRINLMPDNAKSKSEHRIR